MLDPLARVGNVVLHWLGGRRIAFFSDGTLIIPTIAAVNIWRTGATAFAVLHRAFQTIPERHLLSRSNRGKGEPVLPWKKLYHITTSHLLRPTFVFVLVTALSGSFKCSLPFAVTTRGGGPGYATRNIVWYIYQEERPLSRSDGICVTL